MDKSQFISAIETCKKVNGKFVISTNIPFGHRYNYVDYLQIQEKGDGYKVSISKMDDVVEFKYEPISKFHPEISPIRYMIVPYENILSVTIY